MGKRKETWTASDVLCPFYCGEGKQGQNIIYCEGFSAGLTVALQFRQKEQKQRHMGIHCVGRFQRCPVYKNTIDCKYIDA